eukprot:331335-Alexandrium_andersonii.AAC.1
MAGWAQVHVALRNAASRMLREAAGITAQVVAKRRDERQLALADKRKGAALAFRALRKPPTDPLAFVQAEDGAVVSEPALVDSE